MMNGQETAGGASSSAAPGEGEQAAVFPRDKGIGEYGCTHYRRRCKLRAPCCGELFDCRHCHNEAKNAMERDERKRHDLPRHDVKTVVCTLCQTEQEVRQDCGHCGVRMGAYFCPICRFFDDEVSKAHFHCNECGICRVGGKDNFFHCPRCDACYGITLRDNHRCVEKSMHQNCPVCFEYLFDSLRKTCVLTPCCHTIHFDCLNELKKHHRYACPICYKSIGEMSQVWERLDREVAQTPMPEEYRNKRVRILCNDCGESGEVLFHIVGMKCPRAHCGSYNTRQLQ